MRVHFGDTDVSTIVSQMDLVTGQLRDAWNQAHSQISVMFTQDAADAANARMASLHSLIDDLDVGGVARQHVFFPLDGQTSDDAWATWKDTAEYVRQGLTQHNVFVSKWALLPTLGRIVGDVGGQLKSTGTTLLWVVGGLVALEVLRVVGSTRRAFSGYRRRRR